MGYEKYLITTQSYKHQRDGAVEIPMQYGYLVETDFQGFMRRLSVPTPTATPYPERVKSGLRGIVSWDGKIYAASWNSIYIIDYSSFEIVDSFSHPLMADLHGIYIDEQSVWVASSLFDLVLTFDRDWNLRGVLSITNTSLYPRKIREPVDLSRDYRLHGKSKPGFKSYHANHVVGFDKDHVLVTGRGDKDKNGRVILVHRETMKFRIWLDHLFGPHDGLFTHADRFAVTETNTSAVAIFKITRNMEPQLEQRISIPESEARFWTRGLTARANGNLLVGRSVWKGDDRLASVVELSADGKFVAEHMLEIPDYPECRIFQIIPAPRTGSPTPKDRHSTQR